MTRRSMPSSFHVNLFALMPVRCSSSTCEAVMAGTGADFGLRPFFMRASSRLRKMRPTIWLNSGTRFPVGAPSGNCDPEYRPKLGCSFPNGLVSESVSRNIGSERDTVSQTGLKRKLRPSLRPQNGTQFPLDQPSPPFRHSAVRISSLVHRKYMNRCSMHLYLPAPFLSKNFATP